MITWILIGVIVIWFLYRSLNSGKGIHTITTDEMKPLLGKKERQFIDVRTPEEFQNNHIKGFKNIPINELQNRMQELSKDKGILVICQSGMRSSKACKLLKENGFNNVTNVKGGMSSYRCK